MKNDKCNCKCGCVKIKTEKIENEKFFPVPIYLTKAEYDTLKKYDEALIAKIIGCAIFATDETKTENFKGMKIQLIIKS